MKWCIALIILTQTCLGIKAQKPDPYSRASETLPFGVIEKISSEQLNEERILNIYLPQGYSPDSARNYPVIYLLDGSAHEDYPHIAGLVQFMSMYNLMPPSIVVGIANVNRYRDFTYPSAVAFDNEINPDNGGSPQFIAFLESELKPFVTANYKTDGTSTIIGQSLGGLLATEILLTKPQLFDDYIIVSPSLWWDEQRLLKETDSLLQHNSEMRKRVFISRGSEGRLMNKVANKLVRKLKHSGHKHLEVYYQPIKEENHATILHRAVYAAFETLNYKLIK
jgi:hypothetical protein